MSLYAPTAEIAWRNQLALIAHHGETRSPRGRETLELHNAQLKVDMRRPVVTCAERKLSYQFMAAEAYWILAGDDTVAGIAPWNKHISQFSDDDERFFGAYGPKVIGQLDYAVKKLSDDPETRQAGLTIWRENPPQTKDYPCTIAMWFTRRGGILDLSVFMRSSDIWLGLPYDIFNFSMVAHEVCQRLNNLNHAVDEFTPGFLSLTMVSSHMYLSNLEDARAIINEKKEFPMYQRETPRYLYGGQCGTLLSNLHALRDTKPGDGRRWWEIL